MKFPIKTTIAGAVLAVSLVTGFNSFIAVSAGEKVRVQNTASGNFKWHQSEGVQFKAPFFSTVSRYTDVATIAVTDDEDILDTASVTRSPMAVTFVDNYGGRLEASVRVKLPSDTVMLEAMHQDVKSQDNLYGNTYQTFIKDILNLTTDQFLAQDFMQGGKGAFKQRLTDQAANGMLVTKRERIPVETQVADQASDATKVNGAKAAKQYVNKVVIQTDGNNVPLRREHSLAKYGIEVVQVDLGEFHANPDLLSYIKVIKDREKIRGKAVADQSLERDKAVTEQLKGNRERITAKNKLNITKDAAVIKEEQKTAVITEQGKQAVQQKLKEQGIATANLEIEKANYKSKVYEAKSVKEIGFAEAAVIKAKYAAIDPKILAMEVDKAKALALYDSKMVVNMPKYWSNGATGGDSSLEAMTSMKVLEMLGTPVTK